MTPDDAALLIERVIAVEVELFDAVDAALRAEPDAPVLVGLLPLRIIAARSGCRVQELAAGLGISVGGASKSADRLERTGWIRRVAHPTDRRSTTLELTDAGRSALAAGNAVAARIVRERIVDVIGEGDAARMSDALARVRRGGPDRPAS